VPALSRVFDAALAGGGAKGINFNELAADLAQITFDYPFRIPPYFALIIRAIGVLEGIALVADPDFAIVDEAYPYISKTLLTNPSDRLRATFRYMVYGKEGVFDADRLIDLLRALEAFRISEKLPAKKDDSKETPVSSAVTTPPTAATGSTTGFTETPVVGLVQDAVKTETRLRQSQMRERRVGDRPTSWARSTSETSGDSAREALTFLLSEDGQFFQEFLVEETVKGIDCLGRRGINELAKQLVAVSPLQLIPGVGKALLDSPLGPFGDIFAPPLTTEEERVLENTRKVIVFLAGDLAGDELEGQPSAGLFNGLSLERVRSAVASAQRSSRDPVLANGARGLAARLSRRLFDVVNVRALRYVAGQIDPQQRSVSAALAGAA
jgi:aarF domain-containing kinase